MEQGFVLAHMLGLENIMVEGDALQTIRAVQAKDCKGVAGHIIAGIIQEMSKFQIAVTRHISRNGTCTICQEVWRIEELVWYSSRVCS